MLANFLSSADAGGAATRSRRENLSRVFGDVFDEIELIGLGASKGDLLARFDPADWVDDHLPNAIAGFEAGHRTHVIRQSHNRSCESGSPSGLLWALDLLEVHDRIGASLSLEL